MSLTLPEQVRLNIGDTEEPYLLDDQFIEFGLYNYPQPEFTEGAAVYLTTIRCLEWLCAKSRTNSASGTEKVGDVTVSEGSNVYEGVCGLLDYWKKNPPSSSGVSKAVPIIGGGKCTPVTIGGNSESACSAYSNKLKGGSNGCSCSGVKSCGSCR